MHKTRESDRQKAVAVQEKDLRFAMGGDEAKQHVDNPAQSPMKDDHP